MEGARRRTSDIRSRGAGRKEAAGGRGEGDVAKKAPTRSGQCVQHTRGPTHVAPFRTTAVHCVRCLHRPALAQAGQLSPGSRHTGWNLPAACPVHSSQSLDELNQIPIPR